MSLLHRARLAGRMAGLEAAARLGRWPYRDIPPARPGPAPEMIGCLPGLYEPGQLDRVTACGFGRSLADERAMLDTTAFAEEPMTVHPVGAATILGTHVLTERQAYRVAPPTGPPPLLRALDELGTVRLMNTMQGMVYFGHWLGDDCPMREAFQGDPCARSMVLRDWPDRHGYAAAFGQDWREVAHVRVADLTLYRKLGYNRDKVARIRSLRARLRASRARPGRGGIVYLARGPGGAGRNMADREAFEAAMAAAGIRVVTP